MAMEIDIEDSVAEKEQHTLELTEDALVGVDTVCIGYSGGKDSDLARYFIRKFRKDAISVFCNTTVDAKETIQHCRSMPDVVEIKPDVNFWWCADKYGLPKTKGHGNSYRGNACCYYLKEKPMKLWIRENKPDLLVDGLTLAESHQRAMALSRDGHFHYVKTWNVAKLHPIYRWTPKEVLYYLRKNNIPYNPKYDTGSKRIGCITCTAFKGWDSVMQREYPKLFNKINKIYLAEQGQKNLTEF